MTDEPRETALPETARPANEPEAPSFGSGLLPEQAPSGAIRENLSVGWHLATYVACAFFTVYLTMWFGASFFRTLRGRECKETRLRGHQAKRPRGTASAPPR